MRNANRDRRDVEGFTVVEMVIVFAIIGVLVGLLLPAIQRARGSARRAECLNNVRQLSIGLQLHHDAHARLPPQPANDLRDPNLLLHWQALITPFVGETPFWESAAKACREDPVAYHNPPHFGNATQLRVLVCPGDRRLLHPMTMRGGDVAAFTSYIGVAGTPNGSVVIGAPGSSFALPLPGVLGNSPGIRFADVADGLSQTLMVGERPPPASGQAGRWYSVQVVGIRYPGPDGAMRVPGISHVGDVCVPSPRGLGPGIITNPCDRFHFWSVHGGGGNFAFADGSTRFMPYTAAAIIPSMASRAGGEAIVNN